MTYPVKFFCVTERIVGMLHRPVHHHTVFGNYLLPIMPCTFLVFNILINSATKKFSNFEAAELLYFYSPKIKQSPASISCISSKGRMSTFSEILALSITPVCDTTATESLGSPLFILSINTFSGASASIILVVNGTARTVWSYLILNASFWTITTGLLNPGSLPYGIP